MKEMKDLMHVMEGRLRVDISGLGDEMKETKEAVKDLEERVGKNEKELIGTIEGVVSDVVEDVIDEKIKKMMPGSSKPPPMSGGGAVSSSAREAREERYWIAR